MSSWSSVPVNQRSERDRLRLALWTFVLVIAAGLLLFSQTLAGYADEGLHLMAAQFIALGRRPYLDFFFQHPPLYSYLNAVWLRSFEWSWRGPHALATLLTGGAILLIADFVYLRLQLHAWRMAAAITAALLLGLNSLVFQFGTIAQPYGACLFLTAAAFRLIVAAARERFGLGPVGAGVCAGAAASSLILAAPIVPILLVWLIWRTAPGHRSRRGLQFLAGCLVPSLPLLWLAVQGPRQVLFDLIQFHLFYRGLAFRPPSGIARWDLSVIAGGLLSTQSLVVMGLAVIGVTQAPALEEPERAELYLAAALAVGLGLLAAASHPVFEQYFVLALPFLTILAALGFYSLGSRLWPASPVSVTVGVVALFSLHLYQYRGSVYPCWQQIEETAQAINAVAPPTADIYSDYEAVYFAAHRLPPPGLENRFAPVLRLPPAAAALFHVVPQPLINDRLSSGRFAAALILAGDASIDSLGLQRVYRKQKEITCYRRRHYLFWDPVVPPK